MAPSNKEFASGMASELTRMRRRLLGRKVSTTLLDVKHADAITTVFHDITHYMLTEDDWPSFHASADKLVELVKPGLLKNLGPANLLYILEGIIMVKYAARFDLIRKAPGLTQEHFLQGVAALRRAESNVETAMLSRLYREMACRKVVPSRQQIEDLQIEDAKLDAMRAKYKRERAKYIAQQEKEQKAKAEKKARKLGKKK